MLVAPTRCPIRDACRKDGSRVKARRGWKIRQSEHVGREGFSDGFSLSTIYGPPCLGRSSVVISRENSRCKQSFAVLLLALGVSQSRGSVILRLHAVGGKTDVAVYQSYPGPQIGLLGMDYCVPSHRVPLTRTLSSEGFGVCCCLCESGSCE